MDPTAESVTCDLARWLQPVLSQSAIYQKSHDKLTRLLEYWATPEEIAIPLIELSQQPYIHCTVDELKSVLKFFPNLHVDKEREVVIFELRPEQSTLLLEDVPSHYTVLKILEILRSCPYLRLEQAASEQFSMMQNSGLVDVVPQHWGHMIVWHLTFISELLAFQVACWFQQQNMVAEKFKVRVKLEPRMPQSEYFKLIPSHRKRIPHRRPQVHHRKFASYKSQHKKYHQYEGKQSRQQPYSHTALSKSQQNDVNPSLTSIASTKASQLHTVIVQDDPTDFPPLSEAICLMKIDTAKPRKKVLGKPPCTKEDPKRFKIRNEQRSDDTVSAQELSSSTQPLAAVKVF